MTLPKINKFSKDFLDTLKAQGVSSKDLKLIKRMRGITIKDFGVGEISKDTVIRQNVTFEYDYLESE